MHFKVTIDGDVQVFRNVNTNVKIKRRIYLDAPTPYEVPIGLTPGEFSCEHSFPWGDHEATIEAYEPTATYKTTKTVLVSDGKITII